MPRKKRQLKQDLHKAGFVEIKRRGKGSHSVWKHPDVPGVTAILSGQDGDDADGSEERHVAAKIAEVRQRLGVS
jgi:predicted RNA binding protein YcfA (HicA-like mRNA interferase family)